MAPMMEHAWRAVMQFAAKRGVQSGPSALKFQAKPGDRTHCAAICVGHENRGEWAYRPMRCVGTARAEDGRLWRPRRTGQGAFGMPGKNLAVKTERWRRDRQVETAFLLERHGHAGRAKRMRLEDHGCDTRVISKKDLWIDECACFGAGLGQDRRDGAGLCAFGTLLRAEGGR